jgi:hypothetical protein
MSLLNRNQLDEQKVKTLQGEINDFIDARAEDLRAVTPGVPVTVLRNILTNRSGGCECRAYLQIKQQDAEDAERAKR